MIGSDSLEKPQLHRLPWHQKSNLAPSSPLSSVILTFLHIQNPSFISEEFCFSHIKTAKLGLKWLVLLTTSKMIMLNEPKTVFTLLYLKNAFNLLRLSWRCQVEPLAFGSSWVLRDAHALVFHSLVYLQTHFEATANKREDGLCQPGGEKAFPRMRERYSENQGNESIRNGLHLCCAFHSMLLNNTVLSPVSPTANCIKPSLCWSRFQTYSQPVEVYLVETNLTFLLKKTWDFLSAHKALNSVLSLLVQEFT